MNCGAMPGASFCLKQAAGETTWRVCNMAWTSKPLCDCFVLPSRKPFTRVSCDLSWLEPAALDTGSSEPGWLTQTPALFCGSGEVEILEHIFWHCPAWLEERFQHPLATCTHRADWPACFKLVPFTNETEFLWTKLLWIGLAPMNKSSYQSLTSCFHGRGLSPQSSLRHAPSKLWSNYY